ncbi:hypothetical protein Taro_036829 [Colocasia esculenta]|uniref:Protein kinase domain-containing protein n=1 Tax=Colocasia esculenta TaxID=4460 RepID=A0A843WAY8_COLES|nr:hypothetical protein [Colocasia esculenta]
MRGGNRGGWIRGRCLGRGSTAAVYLAASTSGDRETFAVKSAELSRSSPLQREERILSSVCSPHVVSCLGSDVTVEPDGRVLFNLFLEYVPGGDLAEVVKRQGGLDESTIVLYTRGVLNGLVYLHGRGIVHCDVKGKNVLLGLDDGVVKLADLGCATWMDDGCQGRGIISGTPLYMAPEVARGEEQGPAADIWALGCTVIEMATGYPPWHDVQDPVAAIHRIAFSEDVPEFPCNLSDDARDFLGRCLSRDPRKRWSAEELLSHSFLKRSGEFPKECSPKSTLDLAFWDSWSEEELEDQDEAETDDQRPGSAQERLRHLVSGGLPPLHLANASWDDCCWIPIRNTQRLEPSTSGSTSAVAAASAYGVSREESLPGQGDAIAVAIRDGGSIADVCNTSSSHAETCVHEAYIWPCRR